MISKFYNKNIAEGKSFLIFSVIFAIFIRLAYILNPMVEIDVVTKGGYLWKPLIPIFENPIYSVIGSSIILILLAFIVNHINTEHAFIRRRTLLPPAICILLFSCMPAQLAMSPSYIGALVLLLIINTLFGAYGSGAKQESTFKVSFTLSLGSLFAPALLLFVPVLWICLVKLRSFSFKAFLASLFSIFILYIPAFSYFYITGNVDSFLEPFVSLTTVDWGNLPVLNYELPHYVILGVVVLLIIIVLIDNSMSSFKDKIRVRTYVSVLTMLSLFSILCTLFLDLDTNLTLYIALAISSLQLAHFFSLAQQRIFSTVFFLFLLIFFTISAIPFMPNEF